MNAVDEIKTKMRAQLDPARGILKAAEAAGRDVTAAEDARIQTHLRSFEALKPELKRAEDSATVKAALDAIGAELHGEFGSTPSGAPQGVKAIAAARWAKDADAAIRSVMLRGSEKALVSGTIDVPQMLTPVTLPNRPLTLLDLIGIDDSPADGNGNQFGYLRETSRPEGAAASSVADGQVKPQGVGTFASITDRLRVYAVLSEPQPVRYLTDFNGLIDVLKVQLGEAVLTSFENDVLTGTGTPSGITDPVLGILNTSGIQTQALSNTVAGVDAKTETALKAQTKVLTNARMTPTAYVLNPSDWEAITLARLAKNPDNVGEGAASRVLHGLPVVLSLALAAGTGIVADWTQAKVLVRDRAKLDIDVSGSLFQTNRFQLRAESRFGLKVGLPAAFVKFALA